jgi:3-oxoacyl-[acyl-carrier protein] reductase
MSQRNLKGKVAIVIRASSEIGRAVALRLSRDGAAIVAHYASETDMTDELVAEIGRAGGQAMALWADVSTAEGAQQIFNDAIGHFGKVDILINDAVIIIRSLLADTKEEEFDRVKAVHNCTNGTIRICEEAARHLADGGRIITFSCPHHAVFNPLFHAQLDHDRAIGQINHVLMKELGPRGITLNTVLPETTDDEMFRPHVMKARKQSMSKLEIMGQPPALYDVAEAVAHLVAADAQWLTGQRIRANWSVQAEQDGR